MVECNASFDPHKILLLLHSLLFAAVKWLAHHTNQLHWHLSRYCQCPSFRTMRHDKMIREKTKRTLNTSKQAAKTQKKHDTSSYNNSIHPIDPDPLICPSEMRSFRPPPGWPMAAMYLTTSEPWPTNPPTDKITKSHNKNTTPRHLRFSIFLNSPRLSRSRK